MLTGVSCFFFGLLYVCPVRPVQLIPGAARHGRLPAAAAGLRRLQSACEAWLRDSPAEHCREGQFIYSFPTDSLGAIYGATLPALMLDVSTETNFVFLVRWRTFRKEGRGSARG